MLPRNTVRRLPAGSGRGAAANLRAHPVRVSARSYDRPGGGRRGPGAAPGRAGGIAGARGPRDGGRLVVAAARRRRDHLVRRPLPRGPDAGLRPDRAEPPARRAAARPTVFLRRYLPRRLAALTVLVLALGVLAGVGYVVARRVRGQSARLLDQASGVLGHLRARLADLPGIRAGASSWSTARGSGCRRTGPRCSTGCSRPARSSPGWSSPSSWR